MSKIQIRRGAAVDAAASNPVLAEGEPGWEKDTGIVKIGDGATAWNDLPEQNQLLSRSVGDSVYETQSGAVTKYARRGVPEATTANTHRLLSKLRRNADDANLLVLGDSTGNETTEWVYLAVTDLAARYPAYTVRYRLWDDTSSAYAAPVTIQTGTGTHTLDVWNCSVAGQSTWYTRGSRWPTAVTGPDADLVLVSYGHNEGTTASSTTAAQWRSQMLGLTESLALDLPYAGIALVLQNPRSDNDDQAKRMRVYEEIASMRGYGVINVHDAFLDTGNPAAYVKSDSIHPTTVNEAPATNGSRLWADTILAALDYRRTSAPRGQQMSALASTSEQLLTNGDFSAFTGSVPDGWTVSGAITTKDTRAGYFDSAGYGVRIQATGAAQSLLSQFVSNFGQYKGKWVTLAVRSRIDSANTGTAGRIALADGTQTITSQAVGTARDGLLWQTVTMKVSPSATYLRVLLYGDTAASATGDVTIDSAHLTVGVTPRRGTAKAAASSSSGSSSAAQLDFLSTGGAHPAVVASMSGAQNTHQFANSLILVQVKPHRDMNLNKLVWFTGTTLGGNYDIAIYNDSGSRLWSKGSTAYPTTANTAIEETVSPSVALTAGTRYWVALGLDGTTAQWRGASQAVSGVMRMADGTYFARTQSSSFPAPSSIAIAGTESGRFPLILLREA